MTSVATELAVPVTDRDHMIGPLSAPLTLVEYADFECPYSGMARFVVRAMQRALGDQLCYVFRPFPLTQIHPHARHAAEAAEAAAAQGKFWEMHDTLFEHQDALEDADLVAYSQALDLDVRRVATELAGGAYGDRVTSHVLGGVASGVHGTPTFFINGRRYEGSWQDAERFLEALAAG
jgi:protein-disulfide isomerase